MNRGLVNLKELRENKYHANFYGKSAFCFVIGNKIVKVYARACDGDYFQLEVDKINDFSKYEADTIVFPDTYIMEKGHKAGEISNYIDNKSVEGGFNPQTNINKFVENYELVIGDIMTYSNIYMDDLCNCNVLYSDTEGFHLIDTTEWILRDNSTRYNLREFNKTVFDAINETVGIPVKYSKLYNWIDVNYLRNIKKYGNQGEDLKKVLEAITQERFRVLDLIFTYSDLYRKHYGEEAKTMEDMQEFTKVLKKG